jgi:hypothetical protein
MREEGARSTNSLCQSPRDTSALTLPAVALWLGTGSGAGNESRFQTSDG